MNISNLIIIWNNDNLKDLLRLQYGAANIICSAKELNNHNLSFVQGIIVLCELNWDEHGHDRLPSEFYGIELVKRYFRTLKHLHVPVLFVSVMPKSYFETSPKNMILDALGHSFMQLEPLQWNIWKEQFGHGNLLPLNEIQFADIQSNYCNLGGQIGEVAHRTKGRIANLIHEPEIDRQTKFLNIYNTLNTGLSEICQLLGNSIVALGVRDHLLDEFNKGIILSQDLTRAGTFMQQHEEVLRALADETEVTPLPIAVERPWKALVLDDEPASLELIIDALHANGVTTIVCSHVDQSQIVIEEDEKNGNFISVLISDYRLFEPGTTRHQSRQGYDFLLDTAKRERFTSFVALSGLGRQFLLESFRKYNLRVEVYSKDDLRSSERARQVFAENIVQLGEEIHKTLVAQPVVGLARWKTQLKPFYLAYRNSVRYTQYEQNIRKSARRYVLTVKNIFDDTDPNRLQLSVVTPFPGLRTELKSVENKKHVDVFLKILEARRIAIWLLVTQEFDTKTVYAIINDGNLDSSYLNKEDPKEKDTIKGKVNGLLNTDLCISTKEFPEGLLVEEVAWLKYDMGIDIYDMRIVLSQVHEHFNECLNRYPQLLQVMAQWSELEEDFINNNLVLVSVGDVKRVARCMAEKIRDVQEVKIAIQMLQQCLTILEKDNNCLLISDDLKEYVQSKINILYKFN